jgi:Tfp pilus assembly protein PilF
MRTLKTVPLFAAGALGVYAALTALAACGGNEHVNYPTAAGEGGTNEGKAVTNDQGAQVGLVDQAGAKSDLSGSAKAAYDAGFQAWLQGDLQTAKKKFQDAASADSKSPSPHYSLGIVMEHLGDLAGAQQEYRTAFTLDPNYEFAMGAYALSLANSGHAGEADTFISDKKAKFPNSARIETYAAEVKSIAGDHGSAQQLAQDALRLDPNYKEAMVVIARDNYRARKMELAKYALQAILDGFGDANPPRDKENAEAHLLRGLILRETPTLRAAAVKDFEAAKAKRPDMAEALIQLGSMKIEAGNGAEAQPLLESAVRFQPQSAQAHLNLGDCYRVLSRPADAKREFDQALALDSTLSAVHYDLGLMYLYASSIPGMSATDQIGSAIKELNTYKTMRGPKAPPGVQDDIDDLIARAQAKQNELKQGTGTPAAAAAPAAAPASAAPAGAAGGAAPAAKPDAGLSTKAAPF